MTSDEVDAMVDEAQAQVRQRENDLGLDVQIDELSAALERDAKAFARGDDCDLENGSNVNNLSDAEILKGALDRNAWDDCADALE